MFLLLFCKQELYFLTENKIFKLINNIEDKELKEYIFLFKNINQSQNNCYIK